jgi:arylformamidase
MAAPIYKQYDQQQLDAQYNLRARHPDFQSYFDAWERDSEAARKELAPRLDVAYGDTPLQNLDVFPARKPGSPLNVFIHGGFWQFLDKRFFRFPARPLVAAGAAFVTVNYDLAPAVTLEQIAAQCRKALVWCHANAASFNADPARITVSGHSAGAHLALMLALTDWSQHGGLPADLVKGTLAVSGVYDLEPIRLSYLNATLKLDADSARRSSPLYQLGRHAPPLVAAVGGEETNEFRRQNGMLATALRARGLACDEMTLPGLNHYTIILALGEKDSALTRALLTQMSL